MSFFRHRGIYRSDVIFKTFNPGEVHRLPLVGALAPVRRRDGRAAPGSSSAMSSGRLFLDRDALQQSPSPLHRHPQNKMIANPNGRIYHRTVTSVLTGCLSAPQRRRSLVGEGPTQVVVGRTW